MNIAICNVLFADSKLETANINARPKKEEVRVERVENSMNSAANVQLRSAIYREDLRSKMLAGGDESGRVCW